jgi:hypothetical protein
MRRAGQGNGEGGMEKGEWRESRNYIVKSGKERGDEGKSGNCESRKEKLKRGCRDLLSALGNI